MGKAFCIGLLDFYNINPVSRIASSNLKTIEGVKNDLMAHYPIFIPKKKEGDPKENKKGAQRKANSLQRPNNTLRHKLSGQSSSGIENQCIRK